MIVKYDIYTGKFITCQKTCAIQQNLITSSQNK
jgi:hypothetical protein